MIDGIVFGCLIFASTVFTWMHLPQWLKNFSIKHFIISELMFTLSVYITVTSISQSLVAVIAAITAGLLANIATMIYGRLNDTP
jgi:hypothetical protein